MCSEFTLVENNKDYFAWKKIKVHVNKRKYRALISMLFDLNKREVVVMMTHVLRRLLITV